MLDLKRVQPEWLNEEIEKLNGTTEEDLRRKWNDLRVDLSQLALKAVAIVVYAENNGIDMNWIPASLLKSFRAIAYGYMDINAWLRFQGTAIVRYLQHIPKAEQNRLARGEKLDLVVVNGSSFDKRKVDPLDLSQKQIYQIFSTDGIRSESAQICYIESERTYMNTNSTREEENGYAVSKNKVIFRRNMVMKLEDILVIYKIMGG